MGSSLPTVDYFIETLHGSLLPTNKLECLHFEVLALALRTSSSSFAMRRTDSSEGVHHISVRDTRNLLLELFPAQEYDIIQGQNSLQFAVIVQHWKPANTRLLKYLERFVEPRVWGARMQCAGS